MYKWKGINIHLKDKCIQITKETWHINKKGSLCKSSFLSPFQIGLNNPRFDITQLLISPACVTAGSPFSYSFTVQLKIREPHGQVPEPVGSSQWGTAMAPFQSLPRCLAKRLILLPQARLGILQTNLTRATFIHSLMACEENWRSKQGFVSSRAFLFILLFTSKIEINSASNSSKSK